MPLGVLCSSAPTGAFVVGLTLLTKVGNPVLFALLTGGPIALVGLADRVAFTLTAPAPPNLAAEPR